MMEEYILLELPELEESKYLKPNGTFKLRLTVSPRAGDAALHAPRT